MTTGPGGSPPATPAPRFEDVVGHLPYRIQLAGGWIDQPWMSCVDPEPPGSMVVVSLRPTVRFMDRCGMATGTRAVARALWGDHLPDRDPMELVRELYASENEGQPEPSGSQDMIGLIVPGVSRLDYDASVEGGWFPAHIESTGDRDVCAWLERVIHLVPVAPRPHGYAPLGVKHLDPAWVRRLGRSGWECYDAIVRRDIAALGASLTETAACWDALLPDVHHHSTLSPDLRPLLTAYQGAHAGAMYSGCGGGYLVVAAEIDVPGSFSVSVRTE